MHIEKLFSYCSNEITFTGKIKLNLIKLVSYQINHNISLNDTFNQYINIWLEEFSLHPIVNIQIDTNNTFNDVIIDEFEEEIICSNTKLDYNKISYLISSKYNIFDGKSLYLEDEPEFDPDDDSIIKYKPTDKFIQDKLKDCENKLSIIKYCIDNLNILVVNPSKKIIDKLKLLYINNLIRQFKYLDSNYIKIGYNFRVLMYTNGPDLYSGKETYRLRLTSSDSIFSGLFERIVEHYEQEDPSEIINKDFYYLDGVSDEEITAKFFIHIMNNTDW